MLQNFLLTSQPWQKFLLKTLGFVITCIATLGFLMCIVALVIVRVDTPEYLLIPLTTTLLTFAGFVDSFLLAKIFREKGIGIGLSIGLIFAVIICLLAVVNNSFAFTNLFLTKLCAVFFAGILGGIIGVNA